MDKNFLPRIPKIPPLKNLDIFPAPSRLITASHMRGKPTGHWGTDDTLTYCVSGYSIFHNNGQNMLLRPNQMLFSPKGTWRGRTSISEDLVLHEIVVVGTIEGEDLFTHLHLRNGSYIVDVPEMYQNWVTQSFDILLAHSPHTESYIFRAAATATILGVYFAAHAQQAQNDHEFKTLLTYMQSHLASGVSLNDLAALMHMQPTHFIRVFKKAFLQSPIAYYNSLRIAEAIDLLSKTELSLSEIGARIGISDRYYFSNFFKTHCGVSPDHYRKSLRSILNHAD